MTRMAFVVESVFFVSGERTKCALGASWYSDDASSLAGDGGGSFRVEFPPCGREREGDY